MEFMMVAVLGVLVIVAVNAVASRLGVAAPLVLVAIGVGVSYLPFVPVVEVPPEWILMGVLPALLYSAASAMPTMDFRRDFTAISGLSVLLVVLTSVGLGAFFTAVIPEIDLALGIALGAIVSPTDAVATSIVRRLGVTPRVVTLLEGESMLNDASALVILRSAVAATAGTVSLWHVVGEFVLAVVVAVVVGGVVGALNLVVRARLRQATLSTAVSFAAPFVAYAPTEHLGASGLVAAVVAGLVTGWGGARYLRPQDRIAQTENWRTVELLLEGAVFLVIGLELTGILDDVSDTGVGLRGAVLVALATVVLLLVLRAAYVAVLLAQQRRRLAVVERYRERIDGIRGYLDGATAEEPGTDRRTSRRWRLAARRRLADLDYHSAARLGVPEGTLLVWAGMRGVVTLAAAQSLDRDTPDRAALVLIAFVVAVTTLLVQGGTLPWVVRRLDLARTTSPDDVAERRELLGELSEVAGGFLDDPSLRRPDGEPYDEQVLTRARSDAAAFRTTDDADDVRPPRPPELSPYAQLVELRLRSIAVQREALLHARSIGEHSSETLGWVLQRLDAEQIRLEHDAG